MAPPIPPPRDNPIKLPYENLLEQTISHPERFCRKCGQWLIGHASIACSLCTLLTHDTCVDPKPKNLPKHKNYFFVCDQCRGDLKESVTKYSERSKAARENFAKLQETIELLEAEKLIANEKLAKERSERIDAERARDDLRNVANNSARSNPLSQARKRPRNDDLPPDQIQTLNIIDQAVESHLAPINQQLRSVLSNIRDQNERPSNNEERTVNAQPRNVPRRLKQTFAAAITKSSTPTTTFGMLT